MNLVTAEQRAEVRNRRPTEYRRQVFSQISALIGSLPPAQRALDFGSGDGWFAHQIERAGYARMVAAADVMIWPGMVKNPVLFDGKSLPLADRSFELTYAIDVLHHCPNPERALDEVLRCTARHFLIKDHSYRNVLDWATLCVLDEVGNRRFGVATPHQYQEHWVWSRCLEARGFTLERLIHPAPCHTGLVGRLTNHLQFLALWRRSGAVD
jgi:SAM-dependent methyltransferase